MRAHERKAVLVVVHGTCGYTPAANRVALLAVAAHLTAVNIRVAIGAALTHIRKNQLDMTLCARNAHMHFAQWVSGLVVIKVGSWSDRLPACRSVTAFARDAEVSMRIACPALLFLICHRCIATY